MKNIIHEGDRYEMDQELRYFGTSKYILHYIQTISLTIQFCLFRGLIVDFSLAMVEDGS
jgi:hypothetical protein